MAYSMSLNNRISCVVEISIFGFNKYWHTVFNFMGINVSPTFKQFLRAKNSQRWEKQSILSMIQCKNNESLPKAGDDKTENIREHTCEVNWDELQSINTSWNNSSQHGQIKSTLKEINWKNIIRSNKYGASVAPPSTYALPQGIYRG